MEIRNAFVIMKEPGYANRALLDAWPTMEKISHISPTAGEEIATRSKLHAVAASLRDHVDYCVGGQRPCINLLVLPRTALFCPHEERLTIFRLLALESGEFRPAS